MAGQTPFQLDYYPDYFGPVVVTLFGDAAIPDDDGGGGTTTATTILTQAVFHATKRTVIHRITLHSAAAAAVDIDFFKHASGVAAASGTEVCDQEAAIVDDVPLVMTLDEDENILDEGDTLSIVLSAAPAAPIVATIWLYHGRYTA